jgi:predicted ribosome quality control (RQC) complex YloA/Tae2 family protein
LPFDGVVIKSVIEELSETTTGSRIEKIFQPESDEIVLHLRGHGRSDRLVLSANAGCPRIHLTGTVKNNPKNPPMFCMLLRKYISGGRIDSILTYDFERMASINIEAVNELGDRSLKKLVIEIMGRHSNIILLNEDDIIIDSIKHVDIEISSKREVMPARPYQMPPAQDKKSPPFIILEELIPNARQSNGNLRIGKFLLSSIKGFSPLLCNELCYRANVDEKISISELSQDMEKNLTDSLTSMFSDINAKKYRPCIIYRDTKMQKPSDFHCMDIYAYPVKKHFDSINLTIDTYYSHRDSMERLSQKSSSMVRLLNTNIDRCMRKISYQQEELSEALKSDELRLYGELLTANLHNIPEGSSHAVLPDYYSSDGKTVSIPLNENISPQKNAQNYFKKYKKAKRTFENVSKQLKETKKELSYLESVLSLLENCKTPEEIDDIKEELVQQGYIARRKSSSSKKKDDKPSPVRYKSSDGIYIYAGKNNIQNDYLTLKLASSKDLWLHTRNIPGSHVVIRKLTKSIPDTTIEEAALIAAWHSKSRHSANVPVDYTEIKYVKKPSGAKPGMVIYENFKTVIVTPDEEIINRLLD